MLIGFAANTNRLFPKIFCKSPRHCAPIIKSSKTHYVMYQFVRRGYVAQISLSPHAITILKHYGWEFINIRSQTTKKLPAHIKDAKTCVDLCKRILNIRAPLIQTSRALYKKLKRQQAL